MKIGIVTLFYNNYNYGGILQAYALQKKLGIMGYQSEIILLDRKHSAGFRHDVQMQVKARSMVNSANKHLSKLLLRGRRAKYKQFINENVVCSPVIYDDTNIKELNLIYDCFIAGSDQVWHPESGRDSTFLKFAEDNAVKIAYAASIGADAVEPEYAAYMAPLLSRFHAVSVREQPAAEIVISCTNKPCSLIADPVFLFSGEEWRSLCKMGHQQHYVLLYLLGDSAQMRKIARRVARDLKLQLYIIPYNKMKFNRCDTCRESRKFINTGPLDFLTLIQNAECIITDSFHCAAFSIILNKKFCILCREDKNVSMTMNLRLQNLVKLFGLESHIASANACEVEKVVTEKPDYIAINEALNKESKRGARFLSQVLTGIGTGTTS